MKCRHGKEHHEDCAACGAEYRRLENYRAGIKRDNDAAVAKARETGRNHTMIAKDGCEVTATPDGHVFYNAADWY